MSFLLAWYDDALVAVGEFFGEFFYSILKTIFGVIDTVQSVFNAFAGIGDISYGGTTIGAGGGGGDLAGQANREGIVYYLMQNEVVTNLLASIMLLALLLIVIFTTMAFLKNLYVSKPKNWKEIIGSSIKGLANFIFLPVCCLFGVWAGNILLRAINGATTTSGAVDMSRKLFICCSYNANKYRTGEATGAGLAKFIVANYGNGQAAADGIQEGQTNEYYAAIVDNVYAEEADIMSVDCVKVAYKMWNINYLILIVGGIFMLYVLGSLAFAMVKRLFYLLVLFVISPAICALYPLDEGSAVKSWSGEFKKQVLSAYGAVAGLNIFFSLLPLVDKIEIIGYGGFYNTIIQIFVMISGLMIVKDLIGLLTNFTGGDNAFASGSGLMKNAHGAFKKQVGNISGKAAGVHGAFSKANAEHKAGGSWMKSMGKSVGFGIAGSATNTFKEFSGFDVMGNIKKINESRKTGEKEGKEVKAEKDLKSKALTFTENHKKASEKVASAQAGYDIKASNYAKKIEGAGMSEEAKQAELDKLQKEVDQARAEYYKFVEKTPKDIKEKAFGEMGKKDNKSAEQVEAEFMAGRDEFKARQKAKLSQAKLETFDDPINTMVASVHDVLDPAQIETAFADNMNIQGMGSLANKLGKDMETLGDYLKRGMQLNEKDSNVKLTDDEKFAMKKFNMASQNHEAEKEKVQGDINKYADMMAEMAERLAEGGKEVSLASGTKVGIAEDDISKMATQISQGQKLDDMSEAIVRAINEDAKSKESALQKILGDIEKIEKALKKDDKK